MASFVILLIARTARIACSDRHTYIHTDRHTHTHTHTRQRNYCNPLCQCAPRVNETNPRRNSHTTMVTRYQCFEQVYIMRLSMLAPTRDRVGNFPCLEWQACPRGRDIESLKCACETRSACPVKI